ncbi:unnamed protein product [Prunus brigantina]
MLYMHNPAINMAEFMHEKVEDPLQEINLGTEEDPRPTFISKLLEEPLKDEIIALLHDFKDCFAWHSLEMPGLDRGHHQMLSFMDGNAGYNQIMVAEEDIHKVAFMCPWHIGAFEYTVMPFDLRNAEATYQRAMNSATSMTPYALTYGHDAIVSMEIAVQSLKIAQQHNLIGEDYSQAMLLELEGLDASRIDTLNKLLARNMLYQGPTTKRVKNKSFDEGEIVWKVVLPLGTHMAGYGKWSPTWEGPFIIQEVLGLGAYML